MIAKSEKPPSGIVRPPTAISIPSPHGSLIHGRRLPLGPRRTTLVLALLALGLLVASAGSAMASDVRRPVPRRLVGPAVECPFRRLRAGDGRRERARASRTGARRRARGTTRTTASGPGQKGPDATGGNAKGGDAVVGGVTGTSVDIPSAPVQAPAATASGPAPDAVAPAPIVAAEVVQAVVPVAPVIGTVGPDLAAAADTGAAPRSPTSYRRSLHRRSPNCRRSDRSVRWRRACPTRPRPHGRCSRRATDDRWRCSSRSSRRSRCSLRSTAASTAATRSSPTARTGPDVARFR